MREWDWSLERLRVRRVQVTPGFLFVAALLFYQSTPPFLCTFLLAAGLHELGHLFAAHCLRVPVGKLSLTAFGCVLTFTDGALVRDRDLLRIAAAGPLCNLMLALLCMTPWMERWEYAALFGAEHLLLALFNLLPVVPLDGAILCMGMFRLKLGAWRAERLTLALSAGGALLAMGAAAWFGGNAGGRFLLFAAWIGSNFFQKVLSRPCQSRRFPLK